MKTRRFVLGLLGAGGALVVGWSLLPIRQRLSTSKLLVVAPGQSALSGWLKLGADNSVVVVMPKSEMGQGSHTGLAMLLADELDAAWSQIRIEHSPIDKIYNNLASLVDGLPFHPDDDGSIRHIASWMTAKTMREIGPMMTGGSSSIKDLWLPMRQAGASARAMLVGAAAQAWNVPVGEVQVADGVLSHGSGRPGEKSATFGEMAERAAKLPLVEKPLLKTPAQWKLIGKPMPRLEAAAKGMGKASVSSGAVGAGGSVGAGFGIDLLQPGLLYASVLMCPTLGGKVASFDSAAAAKLPGVKKVLAVAGAHGGTGAVAVIADHPWRAMQAAKAVIVVWDEAVPAAAFSSTAAMSLLAKTLDTDEGFAYFKTGDVQAALKTARKTITADYSAPYLAHATLEPMNCTVQFKDGRATVWAPTQVPERARHAAAAALGITDEAVDLQVQFLGGGFGRRLDVDFVAQAATIAKEAGGAPVQTLWPRAEDTQHDFYRPAAVSRFKAGIDAQGKLTAWQNVSAGQAIVPQALGRLYGLPAAGPDKTTSEGAYDQPYEWPNARIGHVMVDLPVQVGFWRSVGHSHQAFFKESFVDEAAHAAGANPLAFREALLQKHPRHLKVLQAVAKLAGWGTTAENANLKAPDGAQMARGMALHHSFGSVVAQVAEVSLTADKTIRVHRVFCVIDCGTAVNPNLIRQQMEGGVVFGLSAALYSQITIDKGRVQQSNFHDYPVLRMAECPAITTEIMTSTEPPEGVGEPGTPPIAPAVANALFALTGQRLRSLPLKLA
jgi:isoquinoline 1-oxidoreductase subunit beta